MLGATSGPKKELTPERCLIRLTNDPELTKTTISGGFWSDVHRHMKKDGCSTQSAEEEEEKV